MRTFIAAHHINLVFYKGGCIEKRLCEDIGIDSYDMVNFGIPKAPSHDPCEEVHFYYKHLQEYFSKVCNWVGLDVYEQGRGGVEG